MSSDKHEWISGRVYSDPDKPAEYIVFCDICGIKQTDDNINSNCEDEPDQQGLACQCDWCRGYA